MEVSFIELSMPFLRIKNNFRSFFLLNTNYHELFMNCFMNISVKEEHL